MAKIAKTETGARVFKTVVADDNATVTFTFGDESRVIAVADYTDAIRARLLAHGIVQKIGDAKTQAGKGATDAERWACLNACADMVAEGDWTRRGDGEGSGPVAGIRYLAYVEYMTGLAKSANVDLPAPDVLRAKYDAKLEAGVKLHTIPEVATIINRLRDERAAKSGKPAPDGAALLADLLA